MMKTKHSYQSLKKIFGAKHKELGKAFPILKRHNKGLQRSQMPQIEGEQVAKFLTLLKAKNITVTSEDVKVSTLKPTQKHFDTKKVQGMVKSASEGKFAGIHNPIIVANDGHILDGHHRWAALMLMSKDNLIKTHKVGLPIKELIAMAKQFEGAKFENLHKVAEAFVSTMDKLATTTTLVHKPAQPKATIDAKVHSPMKTVGKGAAIAAGTAALGYGAYKLIKGKKKDKPIEKGVDKVAGSTLHRNIETYRIYKTMKDGMDKRKAKKEEAK